ncbi:hypothetical protein ACWDKQ_24590 [Saccharopolyspora sp. NPDC000995]
MAEVLEGQLTGKAHGTRNVYAPWPTGVQGGTRWYTVDRFQRPRNPAPPRWARAIERFLRPVAYQGVPAALLPETIADGNPDGVWHWIDGELGRRATMGLMKRS